MPERYVAKNGIVLNVYSPDEVMEKWGIGPHATISFRSASVPEAFEWSSPASSHTPISPGPPSSEVDRSAEAAGHSEAD